MSIITVVWFIFTMLRRGSSTTTTSSPSIASYHPTSIALTRVSLSAVHMFLTALTDEGFFQSAVDGPMLLWKASGECRGILGILAVPEEGNYQKVASLKVTADKWEGPIERDALTTILVYLASGLTVTNCVDTALKARRDPKVGGYLGVGSTRAIPRRVPALERRERRVFSTVRSAEIGGWRNAIEADILAATVGFGSIRPIWCPLCQTMCDKIGMFAEHIVSDNHRKTLQRVLNEGPTVRALTAEIRQDSGSKPVLARVDLIGNYVVPER